MDNRGDCTVSGYGNYHEDPTSNQRDDEVNMVIYV